MPRRKVVAKRESLPDPKFHSNTVAKFVNQVMVSGKKSTAEKIVYGAFDSIAENTKLPLAVDEDSGDGEGSGGKGNSEKARSVLQLFSRALDNIRPAVEVKSRRVGGSTYQVPVEIRVERRLTLAMRWLVEYAKQRSEKSMVLRLAREILEASENKGGAVKKREDVHRMAKANQAFAHYRW